MKLKILSILAATGLLAGCCCDTPEAPVAEITEACVQPGTVEEFVRKVGDRVFFAFDKSALSQDANKILDGQAEWLKKFCQYDITIIGHCDERGSTDYNFALGSNRANAAKKGLVARGVDAKRITVCSEGKENPIVIGNDECSYSKNRVAISVLSGGGAGTTPQELPPM